MVPTEGSASKRGHPLEATLDSARWRLTCISPTRPSATDRDAIQDNNADEDDMDLDS